MALRIETLTAAEHLAFIESTDPSGSPRSVSFLQTPAWGKVKREWRPESIGWRDESGELVGVGLVLYRRLPVMFPGGTLRTPTLHRSLAYIPDGPVIDWSDPDLGRWLRPLAAYVTVKGAFGIRMGPPVATRRWSAASVKAALAAAADPPTDAGHATVTRLGAVTPDHTEPTGTRVLDQLAALGWRPPAALSGGFGLGQPQYVFQVPLTGRDEETVLAGMNQLWRRNIRKAAKAGVTVTVGSRRDLPEFQDLYEETAARDHFTPRPASYFRTMYDALSVEADQRIRLYLGHHEGDLVAATIGVQVGSHVWYVFGASSTKKREVRGMNAVQWRMICDALESGATVYDQRGITDTLDPADSHVGLLQFKVGTGGDAVEYVGEWDLPISRPLYKAFDFYLRRRGG